MKQSWSKRHFGWIADDLRYLVAQLRKRDTWIFIAITAVFATVIYYGFHFALGMDFSLRLRNLMPLACHDIGDLDTTLLFFGAIFLALTVTLVFGEFAHYLDYKRRGAHAQARAAAWQSAGWSVFALAIGLAVVIFLRGQCR